MIVKYNEILPEKPKNKCIHLIIGDNFEMAGTIVDTINLGNSTIFYDDIANQISEINWSDLFIWHVRSLLFSDIVIFSTLINEAMYQLFAMAINSNKTVIFIGDSTKCKIDLFNLENVNYKHIEMEKLYEHI